MTEMWSVDGDSHAAGITNGEDSFYCEFSDSEEEREELGQNPERAWALAERIVAIMNAADHA